MPASSLAVKTIEIANSQVGVREQPLGSNAGPEVNEYLATVHCDPGASWCAAFACWCVLNASQALAIPHHLVFSASALHLFDLNPTLQFDTLTADDLPCIAVYDHGQGKGHVVLPCGLDDSTGQIQTIEGNSNDNGSRNGIGVFALILRNIKDSQLKGFLRIQ